MPLETVFRPLFGSVNDLRFRTAFIRNVFISIVLFTPFCELSGSQTRIIRWYNFTGKPLLKNSRYRNWNDLVFVLYLFTHILCLFFKRASNRQQYIFSSEQNWNTVQIKTHCFVKTNKIMIKSF